MPPYRHPAGEVRQLKQILTFLRKAQQPKLLICGIKHHLRSILDNLTSKGNGQQMNEQRTLPLSNVFKATF